MAAVDDRHFPSIILDNVLIRLISRPNKKLKRFIVQGMVVADIGSGPGFFTIPMAELVGKNGRVYAVDSDDMAIGRLNSKAKKMGVDDIILAKTSSASDLSFIPDNSVDFVWSNNVVCCMLDHRGAFSEVKRILKVGGTAYLSITKFSPKSGPRTVFEEEWERLLLTSGLSILKRGERLTTRWAIVAKRI